MPGVSVAGVGVGVNALIQIQKQYERIPSFACIPGCTKCCGPVPFAEAELAQIQPKPFTGLQCQYATETGCSVYAHRPLLCRLFGAVDDPRLICPEGCGPEKKLTAHQGRTILRHYLKHPLGQDPMADSGWITPTVMEQIHDR